jgi:hypothetical protein
LDGTLAAEPFKGHEGRVLSVAFSPRGDRIASGGEDGAVRLWRLDGPPAPLKLGRHAGAVRSLVFSSQGDQVISGGDDGTVRLWQLDGSPAGDPIITAGDPYEIGVIGKNTLWAHSRNRVWFSDLQGHARGEIRIGSLGFVAITPEGVMASTDTLLQGIIAMNVAGEYIDRPGAVPQIDAAAAWDALLGERRWYWTVYATALAVWLLVNDWYAGLSALGKTILWPSVAWVLIAVSGVLVWVFVPQRLALWAMPAVGRPELPTWKWVTGIITLYGFVGRTRRALDAWLRRHEPAIYAANFGDRPSVKERSRYCDLGHAADVSAFVEAARRRKPALRWIAGVGGKGKSALAFEMARRAREETRRRFVPILVDEDWSGPLSDYVASLLRVDDRAPTPAMVETLGAAGRLLVIVDSLSERGSQDAENSVAEAARRGAFAKMIVTARKPCPGSNSWRDFESIEVRPLTRERLPDYVRTYAPDSDVETVLARLEPLLHDDQPTSPLFARFAIEQTATDDAPAGTPLHLAMRYVEALRAGRLDLSADDMLRASGIAALASVREALAPREIEVPYLRGVLAREADTSPFMNADADKPVEPPEALVAMLETCGLVVQNAMNRRLQFTYDPVAELLAAWRMVQYALEPGIQDMINRVRAAESSGLAMALANAEAMQTQRPTSPRLVG